MVARPGPERHFLPMKTIEARIDESVDELIRNLGSLVGEIALETLARRMRQRPRRRVRRRTEGQAHRKPEEISAITEELYAQICRHPGERMATLSKQMKQPAKKLAFPAQKLLDAGRIKKTGQRQFTRYFPVDRESKLGRRRKTR